MLGLSFPYSPVGCARVRRWIASAGLMLGVALGSAQAANQDFLVRAWTTDDGLPHNTVGRVIQDSAGFLWSATLGGLGRFDGREFREMRPPPEFRSLGFNIRSVTEEAPGSLVLISTGNRLLRLAGGEWGLHPVSEKLAELRESPSDIYVDPSRNVWVVTSGGRLLRWSSEGGTKVLGRVGSTRAWRMTFAMDGDGRLWLGTDALVSVGPDGAIVRHATAPTEPRVLATGRDGKIWMCTPNGLQVIEHGRIKTVCENVPWDGDIITVRHALESRDGSLWLASSRRGAFRFADGELSRVPTPFSSASYVCEDREGSIWLATDGHGIAQLRTKAYQVVNIASGLAHDAVSALAEDTAGAMWLANRSGGLVRVESDGTLHRPAGLAGADIYPNTVAVANGLLWFGGARNPFYRWDPAKAEPPVVTALPGTEVQLLFRARNGDVWFAVGNRVGYLRDNVPRVFSAADGYDPQDTRAIAQEPDGTIWIGSRSAVLQRWDGQRFERIGAEQGLPQLPIHALTVDAGGNLWIATAAGLVLKDGNQFRTVTEANGLADDILMQILEDDRERLWFAARRGLFYAARAELLAAARTGVAKVTSHMFGRNQGLLGFTPTPNYYPTALKARDGRLWFATAQGAVAVDPEKLPRGLPPPPVTIDEVRLDGQVLPKHGALRVPSGARRMEFHFSALSFVSPENVALRHRLEGVDTRWLDTGADRTASYTNLAPGDYRINVMARNSSGQWNADGAALAFVVVPAWWETLWFRSGAVGLLAVFTGWLARTLAQRRFKMKLRRLEQAHALEKERARIARDLHDDLGASLTEVGLLADRLVGTVPREMAPQLSGLAWRTRRLATELSGIVWTMSAQNSSLDRLAEFLRRYAERLFRNTGTACVVKGVEGIPAAPLPPDRQHQLLAAAKEALNNILKHAHATEAVMQMHYADGVFELQIADNGAGFAFDPAVALDGNGLRNMRTRAEEIGGTFALTSGPDGTQVVLRIPCPPAVAPH